MHVSVHWHCLFCELLHVMVLMNLLSLGMIVYTCHTIHYCRIQVLSLSPLANLSSNKGRTFPSGFQILLTFFISSMHIKKESLPLPNWYYNKYTRRVLHQTKIITVVNFLTLVLCSFGQLISLVINKSCQ